MSHTIQTVREMIENGELAIDTHWASGDDATGLEWLADDRQSDLDLGELDPAQSVEGQMESAWLELLQQGHDGTGVVRLVIR